MSNSLNYEKIWTALNELSENSNQLCVIRDVIEDTIPYIEKGDVEVSIQLIQAASVLLKVYIEKFDKNFDVAWHNTIGSMKSNEDFDSFKQKFSEKIGETYEGIKFYGDKE